MIQLKNWSEAAKKHGSHSGDRLTVSPSNDTLCKWQTHCSIANSLKRQTWFFAKPKQMSKDDILEYIDRYGNTAEIERSRVHGVQIHAAHGYLISQFLSPRTKNEKMNLAET